jgi:hypothetical protein
MRHTLTAVFDNRGEAQHSLNRLLAAGYSHADATLSIAAPAGQVDGVAVENLFARLFGTLRGDRPASDPDTSASVRHVLTFTAESEAEVTHATEIVGRLIPVDGEEIHAWGPQGIPGPTHAACRPGTEPGALQNYAHGNSHYFGTRDSDNAFPLGTTFKASSFTATNWANIGVGATHVGPLAAQDLAGQGDDDDESAAYRYGNEMRLSDKFRNRSWNEADADLQSGWELRNPGRLSWDDSESAIRHGWDESSPDMDEDGYHREESGYALAPADDEASRGYQYRYRRWKAATAAQKANWTLHHPGELPPWGKFKDAVLHGWGRISLGSDDTEADSPPRATKNVLAKTPTHAL